MKTIQVPDFGDSGSLYQQVEVPEPGDPGYSWARLPESDPWAKYVNPVMDAAEDDWYAKWNAEHPDNYPCNEPEARVMSEPGTNEWAYETGNYVNPEPGWDAGSPYVDHAHGVVFYDKASEVDAGRPRWPEYRHVGPEREPEAGR